MKQISYLFFLLFTINYAASATEPFPTGLCVGIGGGYSQFKGTVSSGMKADNGVGIEENNSRNSGFSNPSSVFQALIGYLHKFDTNITVGGNFFYNYISGQTSHRQSISVNTVKTLIHSRFRSSNEFGFYGTLGYVVKNFYHPYILMGISSKHFQEITSFEIIDTLPNTQFQKNAKKTGRQTTYLCGAGVELFSGKIRYGVEGVYGYLLSKPIRTSGNVPDTGAGTNVISELRRRSEHCFLFLIKATYNFNIFIN